MTFEEKIKNVLGVFDNKFSEEQWKIVLAEVLEQATRHQKNQSVFDFVYVHLPNLPIESNKSLISALALLRDCLSISMPTFLWPTAFSTAF